MTTATLANWRTEPHSRWAFQHVEHLVKCAVVDAPTQPLGLEQGRSVALKDVQFTHAGRSWNALQALQQGATDGLMVLHRGQVVAEHYAHEQRVDSRHIVFSVSKSITGALAGVLVEQGVLDPQQQVSHYLPLPAGSAYLDCTVRPVF